MTGILGFFGQAVTSAAEYGRSVFRGHSTAPPSPVSTSLAIGLDRADTPIGMLFRQMRAQQAYQGHQGAWNSPVDEHRIFVSPSEVSRKLVASYPLEECGRGGVVLEGDIAAKLEALSRVEGKGPGTIPGLDRHRDTVGVHHLAVVSARGDRPEMQDAHLATEFSVDGHDSTIPIFGVFDGHAEAGHIASSVVADTLVSILCQRLNGKGLDDLAIWNALKLAFVDLDDVWRQVTESKGVHGGTTAVVALLINEALWVANVGDSRAVLSNNGIPIQLSEDAKPGSEKYSRGIKKRGADVFFDRVDGMLGVARAVGDWEVRGVTARPKLAKIPLANLAPEGRRLILACDGLWDVTGSSQAVKHVHGRDLSAAAEDLVTHAYFDDCQDNITVMLVDL